MKKCEVCGLIIRSQKSHVTRCVICRRWGFRDSDALLGGRWVNDKGVMRWVKDGRRKGGAA